MVLLTLIGEAVKALLGNKLRSTLTIIGILIGVTSVIAIVSTVEGMQANMRKTFATLGPNTFIVTRIGFNISMREYLERLRRKKLTRGLIPIIEESCDDCGAVGAEGYARDDVKFGRSRIRRASLEGYTPNMIDIRAMDVAAGRFISEEDDYRRAHVAFIGEEIRERLFTGIDPVGQKIRLGQQEFTVIGVATKVGGLFGQSMDDFIAIPLSTMQKLYPKPGNPVNLVIGATSLDVREDAMDQVRIVLRSIRRVPYEDRDDFEFITPEAILNTINDITRGFRVLLISLPLLSIVVGGIVIMNIMMISVTERTREIGIRKSVGASRGRILIQFLYEALLLSGIGGGLGILFGIWAGSSVLINLLDITSTPTTLSIMLGLSISLGVGLFFGMYPAMRAARLDPIRALSYE